LLGSTEHGADADSREAMRIETDFGFGTLSSSLIGLPSMDFPDRKPVWLFAAGAPGDATFEPVAL